MSRPGRIACINPRCRRTAPADRCDNDTDEIICRKCFNALPPALRDRHRRFWRHDKRMRHLIEKRLAKGTIDDATISRLYSSAVKRGAAIWQAIHNYYCKPEGPSGVETFMTEIGLGR